MSTKKIHAWVIFSFVLLSIFLTLGRVGTAFNSFALLTPDLGVYASLAAAQDHPDLFVRDPFLSNEKNINSYNMVFVPLLRALNNIFGNYGTACAFLLPLIIFLHLTGYYLLGITIFKSPWAGLLVSLLLSAPTTTAYDFWGLLLDALPRFLYQSLIPFVLALSIRYGRTPQWWPVILGTVGILNYVHPLSTPPWAIAIALGLWVSVPEIPFWKKVQQMFVAGMVLLLLLSPFIANYFTSTVVETDKVTNYEQTMSILQTHVSTLGGENLLTLLAKFLTSRTGNGLDIVWYVLWMLGIGGIIYGWVNRNAEENHFIRQITAWMLGIFLVSGILPIVERIVFGYLKQIPPEFELLRTIRYLVPLLLLSAVYALWSVSIHLQRNGALSSVAARYAFIGAGVFLLFAWGSSSQLHTHEFRSAVKQDLSCWRQGQIICDLDPLRMDFIDILDVVREQTPIGARILSEVQDVSIRYYALRPLVFTYKDGAPLAYTNQEQLLAWSQMYDEMDKLAFIRKFPFRHKAFIKEMTELGQSAEADYILLQEPYGNNLDYPKQLSVVYTNDHYSLFKINSK